MPATRKVKVRCSDRDGCGWSGERAEVYHPSVHPELLGEWKPDLTRPCPRCGGMVELVGRTPNPTLELVALARARVAKEA